MTQSDTSDSADRLLIELQLSDAPGRLIGDGRFVLEVKDGIGRLTEALRSFTNPGDCYWIDLRVSELLDRGERDELERLRRTVRALTKAAGDDATE